MQITPHPIIPVPDDDVLIALHEQNGPDAVQKLLEAREERIRKADEDPLNHGFVLPHWQEAEKILKSRTAVLALGGNRCYDGDSTYIYDPVAKQERLASEIDCDFHCFALDVEGNVVVASAEKPYVKGIEEMYDVEFSDGSLVRVTEEHEFLTEGEQAVPLRDMEIGSLVLGYSTQLQHTPAHTHDVCEPHCSQTASDSQSDCRRYSHLCDEHTLPSSENGQSSSPFPSDALERSPESRSSDGPFAILSDSHGKSSVHFWDNLPSSQSEALPHDNSTHLCPSLDQPSQSSCRNQQEHEAVRRDHLSIAVERDSVPNRGDLSRFREQFCQKNQSLRLSPDSSCRQREVSGLGRSRIFYDLPYIEVKRVVSIKSIGKRLVYDHTVPEYGNYLANGLVHKNSGKTEWGARSVVKAAMENDGAEIVCFAQDLDASIRVQQRAVYRYLPPELKKKSKSAVEYLSYTHKNGFTGASFILPNGSTVYFHTYSQFQANRSKFEGLELGSKTPKWLNIGLWLDEYLEDGDLVNTMRFRLATRNALLLITVTPIDGHTPFIASFLRDCQTLATRPAELLNGQEVPLVQLSQDKDAGLVYFHSDLNPFGGYERIKKELQHSPRDEILTRAYGIPVKSMTTLFSKFSTGTHVSSDLPKDIGDKSKWTIYHVVDPAGARNYVCLWAGVNEKGDVKIIKEWPDRDTYGEWATFGQPKWKFGPAAKKLGYDVKGYCKLFTEIEKELGVEVFERIGDSRYFANQNEDNIDLFDRFAEHGFYFVPSHGGHEDEGLAALDDWFSYNANLPLDEANKPICTIHEGCGNLIYSVLNYGAQGKADEALKDFPDALRYLRTANGGYGPEHYGPGALGTTKPTKGGY